MVDVAQVRMFGKTVGAVSWNPQYGIARFEYDDDFVRSGIQPSPILMPTITSIVGYTRQSIDTSIIPCSRLHDYWNIVANTEEPADIQKDASSKRNPRNWALTSGTRHLCNALNIKPLHFLP